MPTYIYQYRAEARVDFDVEAATESEAEKIAEKLVSEMELFGSDNMSDDPGELELLEVHPDSGDK